MRRVRHTSCTCTRTCTCLYDQPCHGAYVDACMHACMQHDMRAEVPTRGVEASASTIRAGARRQAGVPFPAMCLWHPNGPEPPTHTHPAPARTHACPRLSLPPPTQAWAWRCWGTSSRSAAGSCRRSRWLRPTWWQRRPLSCRTSSAGCSATGRCSSSTQRCGHARVHVHTCTHTCTHIHMHTHTCTHTCTHTRAHTHIHTHTHTQTCTHAHVHARVLGHVSRGKPLAWEAQNQPRAPPPPTLVPSTPLQAVLQLATDTPVNSLVSRAALSYHRKPAACLINKDAGWPSSLMSLDNPAHRTNTVVSCRHRPRRRPLLQRREQGARAPQPLLPLRHAFRHRQGATAAATAAAAVLHCIKHCFIGPTRNPEASSPWALCMYMLQMDTCAGLGHWLAGVCPSNIIMPVHANVGTYVRRCMDPCASTCCAQPTSPTRARQRRHWLAARPSCTYLYQVYVASVYVAAPRTASMLAHPVCPPPSPPLSPPLPQVFLPKESPTSSSLRLATGADDGVLRIYDMRSGDLLFGMMPSGAAYYQAGLARTD